jgi:hypothetical protein
MRFCNAISTLVVSQPMTTRAHCSCHPDRGHPCRALASPLLNALRLITHLTPLCPTACVLALTVVSTGLASGLLFWKALNSSSSVWALVMLIMACMCGCTALFACCAVQQLQFYGAVVSRAHSSVKRSEWVDESVGHHRSRRAIHTTMTHALQ